jgi:hypothetical protein
VVPQLADHVLFTSFIVTWAPDNTAANMLRIHDDSGRQ